MAAIPIREADLRILWSRGLFRQDGLLTEDSRKIAIEFPGLPSMLGPDFRSARIVLGGAPRAGDVELHLFTSGWASHRHQGNLEYANVQLHVALWRDQGRAPQGCSGERIPELVLEPYLERPLVELVQAVRSRYPDDPGSPPDVQMLGRLLDAAGDEWLQKKIRRFERLLKLLPADEVAYREFMSALGYSANKAQFEQLAALAPAAALAGKSAAEIESVLSSRAGFAPGEGARMDRTLWRRRGVRPSNYPERRIRAAAEVLSRGNLPEAFEAHLFEENGARALMRWLYDASAGQVGLDRARDIVFNVAVPLLIARGKEGAQYEAAQALRDLVRTFPAPPDNLATRHMKRELFGERRRAEADACVRSMRRHLGLLHWYKGFSGG